MNSYLATGLFTGAELISQAAIDAGVNFFAGYPITPASSIYSAMLSKLQAQGKLAIGVSDEISAISACIGASMRGAKSMTATAAPGLSLMIENLAYAFTTETPLLVVLGQRLGPSTGAATQSAEGDIAFVQNLVAGGFEIPVLAPNSILNCYETTIRAINISEKFRTPVILMTEKDIIMSSTNIVLEDFSSVKSRMEIESRPYRNFDDKQVYKTYNFNLLNEVPDFVAAGIASDDRVVATASFHDKAGNLTKSSPEAFEVFRHLRAKIDENMEAIAHYNFDEDSENHSDKTFLIISFLASDLSARQAVKNLRAQKIKVNHLTLFTLFPIPQKIIMQASAQVDYVLIPEVNYTGQYAEIIRPYLASQAKLLKVNSIADLIKPEQIEASIKESLSA